MGVDGRFALDFGGFLNVSGLEMGGRAPTTTTGHPCLHRRRLCRPLVLSLFVAAGDAKRPWCERFLRPASLLLRSDLAWRFSVRGSCASGCLAPRMQPARHFCAPVLCLYSVDLVLMQCVLTSNQKLRTCSCWEAKQCLLHFVVHSRYPLACCFFRSESVSAPFRRSVTLYCKIEI